MCIRDRSEDVEKSEEIELADDVEELEFAVTGERAEVLEPETAGAEDTASDLPEAQSDKAKSTDVYKRQGMSPGFLTGKMNPLPEIPVSTRRTTALTGWRERYLTRCTGPGTRRKLWSGLWSWSDAGWG